MSSRKKNKSNIIIFLREYLHYFVISYTIVSKDEIQESGRKNESNYVNNVLCRVAIFFWGLSKLKLQ